MIRQAFFRFVVFLAVVTALTAQAQDPSWKTPLAYHVARQCAVASGSKVFVLYDGNYQARSLWSSVLARDFSGALLSWDTEQNALIRTYDRCSGLSDQKIAFIRWCQAARTLVIVYENGNVEVVAHYRDGALDGRLEQYDINGGLVGKMTYKKGWFRDGYCKNEADNHTMDERLRHSDYNEVIPCGYGAE